MTIDDVAVKAISLIAVTLTAAVVAFYLFPASLRGPGLTGAATLGMVLGLFSWLAQLTSQRLLVTYTVVEGILLGAVSRLCDSTTVGISRQSLLATIATFAVVGTLHRAQIVRVSPRFMRTAVVLAASLVLVVVADTAITPFVQAPTPVRDGGLVAIGFSLACVVSAAMLLVVNARHVVDGIRSHLPRRCGWLGGFGVPVCLIWLYLELLRLITYAVQG